MVSMQTLVCQKREIKNKGYVKGLRQNGWVPGIIYGREIISVPVALFEKQLVKTISAHGHRGLFALQLAEESKPLMVLIREMQKNPLTGRLVHIDFLEVNMNEKISSSVGINLIGEEEIAKKGAILQPGVKEVVINCFPQNIPEYLSCDVSELEIGEKKTIGDLQVPEDIEIVSDLDAVVVSVIAPIVPDIEEPVDEEPGEAEKIAE